MTRSKSVVCGGEGCCRLPSCPCSVKKQCGEERRESKGAKEESLLHVEYTESVESSAFSLYHLAKFQP